MTIIRTTNDGHNCITRRFVSANEELNYGELKNGVRRQYDDLINETEEELQQLRCNAVAGAILKKTESKSGSSRSTLDWSIKLGDSKLQCCRCAYYEFTC